MNLITRIKKAHAEGKPELLFGDLGKTGEQEARLKATFRTMAMELHPDRHPGDKLVAEGMALLTVLHQLAEERIAKGLYGSTKSGTPVTIRSKLVYENVRPLVAGDVCDIYEADYFDARSGGTRIAIVKILRDERDADLIDNEARVLTKLWKAPEADIKVFGKYLPRMLESSRIRVEGKFRRANILRRPSNRAFAVAEIMRAYPSGVEPVHAAWMWNRMLEAIAFIHGQGYVHGALTPAHFLLRPDDHGGKLIDFSYAVPIGERIKALSSDDIAFYPPEVMEKRPASPATDIYMSAMCIVALMNGKVPPYHQKIDERVRMHPAFAGLLRACLLSQYARYQKAAEVHKEFSRVARAAFGEPRFHDFYMPEEI